LQRLITRGTTDILHVAVSTFNGELVVTTVKGGHTKNKRACTLNLKAQKHHWEAQLLEVAATIVWQRGKGLRYTG
jgi:hypothetical protein